MGRNWRPKHPVKCKKCGWTGTRAAIAKPCPRCGNWHPSLVTGWGATHGSMCECSVCLSSKSIPSPKGTHEQ